jgi:RimJ/RimL family protein N-acetyltransferase
METDRLILRRWRNDDLEPFAALNADPRVMEFFPAPLSKDEAAAMIAKMEAKFDIDNFGFWALEEKSSGALIGFTGLNVPNFEAPFMPCVEIGWRLAHQFWGKGLATEAGHAALSYAFDQAMLKEVVAFTPVDNIRSKAVMTRLGMKYDPSSDFDHPRVPEGHKLRSHVLYRISETLLNS